MTPDEVISIVFAQIHMMERQVGRVAKAPRIITLWAQAAPTEGIEWHAQAEGTFTSVRMGRQSSTLPVATTGHFLISDADGMVIGWGFP